MRSMRVIHPSTSALNQYCSAGWLMKNTRSASSCSHDTIRQSNLFDIEHKRQKESVGRIEKITVDYEGPPKNVTLSMNKGISTPYDCAKHLNETIVNRSVVALLNNDTLWHMHKPLPDSCKLQLLHYNIPQPSAVNKIFWRSCSFILGAIIKNAFKDQVMVQLHSFPSPNVRSGSFVYDAQLGLDDWKPMESELKVLSLEMIKFCKQNHPIYCLNVSVDLALDIFKHNVHKSQQIPDIAANNDGKVTLFKVGQHVDISRGPLITNTGQLGRITVANVIKLDTDIQGGPIYRFQGVALPSCFILNHFAYGILEERAKQLNSARIPGSQDLYSEDHNFATHAVNI